MTVKTAKYALVINQGATFVKTFRWKADGDPVDLSDRTARMQIRRSVRAQDIWVECTTENGMIQITPLAGEIRIEIPATVTATLPPRSGVYDLEIETSTKIVDRLVEGSVEIRAEVTRETVL